MAKFIVKKTESLKGTVTAPSSKAQTQRAIIAASLSEGKSTIKYPLKCSDTLATAKACLMLGAKIKWQNTSLIVEGVSKPKTPEDVIYCKGSGATIRFLTSICGLADGASVLTGDKSLRRRPMQPLLDALNQLETKCFSAKGDGKPPIIVFGGGIRGGSASIVGNVSSQFISSLLFATSKAEKETRIEVTTPLESKFYVEMTLDTLRKHGVKVDYSPNYARFVVPCNQSYTPFNHAIEGDYSSAAFLLAAASLTKSNVKIVNLKEQSLQGDKIIVDVLKEMGVAISQNGNSVEVFGNGGELQPVNIDLKDSPDLVPVCAALACFADGETIINGVKRLRFKESDRISSLISELGKMGAEIKAENNSLIVKGKNKLHGADICSHKDHRIAMACAVAALKAEGETVIHGIECIKKSYPNFVQDLKALGGKIFGW
ncbi:MAG: 3-phosphoshikimate 1-carboxyvinyltransferase [Candidatus Bathyarchaeia archaeon]